jgi:hypothetical protein
MMATHSLALAGMTPTCAAATLQAAGTACALVVNGTRSTPMPTQSSACVASALSCTATGACVSGGGIAYELSHTLSIVCVCVTACAAVVARLAACVSSRPTVTTAIRARYARAHTFDVIRCIAIVTGRSLSGEHVHLSRWQCGRALPTSAIAVRYS